ncbi:receptor-type tyrosine-protein phosphatase F [Clonorchis sinensis]|uniref:Receptor-type tyrosine-protein phosphatase F n=1 Tax=Clonorchis sinensis TaxID=79923 RepID=G7YA38_CLOSI|nr:receptor-type tyrosine-protein phosphatase F [Clonorchis sinensis]
MISPDSLSLRAKLEMEHNGDTVTCFAQNQVGSDGVSAQITVYSANETPPRGFPKVHQDPSATISQVGSSAQLQCDVSADPRPTVSWIKDQFYPVDLSASRFRLVSIQFPPNINEIPEKVDVAPGQGTNLTCRAGGFPVPMVWWSTLGSPAGPSNVGPVIRAERPLTEPQPHEATLRLTDITESYDYNCIAKNDLGLVRRNVSVVVKELPAAPTGLDARPIGATYAVLLWHKSTSPSVDSYTLSVEAKDHDLGKLGRRQVANIVQSASLDHAGSLATSIEYVSYNLSDLTPYTEYVARVHSVSRSSGLSLPSKPVSFRTAELGKSVGRVYSHKSSYLSCLRFPTLHAHSHAIIIENHRLVCVIIFAEPVCGFVRRKDTRRQVIQNILESFVRKTKDFLNGSEYIIIGYVRKNPYAQKRSQKSLEFAYTCTKQLLGRQQPSWEHISLLSPELPTLRINSGQRKYDLFSEALLKFTLLRKQRRTFAYGLLIVPERRNITHLEPSECHVVWKAPAASLSLSQSNSASNSQCIILLEKNSDSNHDLVIDSLDPIRKGSRYFFDQRPLLALVDSCH